MNIVEKIEIHYATMSSTERKSANQILKNMSIIANSSIKESAAKYHVSTATLMRLAKKIGYSGYSELSFQARDYLTHNEKNVQKPTTDSHYEMQTLMNSFSVGYKNVDYKDLENKTLQLIEYISHANRILAIGIGNSALAAEHLKYLMMSHSILVQTITDQVVINFLHDNIKTGDLIIIYSVSGSEQSYKKVIDTAQKKKAHIIFITMNSEIAKNNKIDLSILLPVSKYFDNEDSSIRYVDSRPNFLVFTSCLVAFYTRKKQ